MRPGPPLVPLGFGARTWLVEQLLHLGAWGPSELTQFDRDVSGEVSALIDVV